MDGNGNGYRDRNGKGRPEWAERDQEWRNGEVSASGAGSGVGRAKRRMLVGDVLEYRGFYEEEGDD